MATTEETHAPPEASLEFLILTHQMRGTIFDVLGPVSAEFSLDRPHVVALLWLSLRSSNVSDIAQAIGLRQNRATVVVDRLSARGLAERVRRTDDRRVVNVRLTDAGRSLVSAVTLRLQAQLDSFLLPLSATELAELISLLRRLVPSGPLPPLK